MAKRKRERRTGRRVGVKEWEKNEDGNNWRERK